jgi:hypothetical protein
VNVFSDPDKEPEKQKPPATTINQELGLPPDQDPF